MFGKIAGFGKKIGADVSFNVNAPSPHFDVNVKAPVPNVHMNVNAPVPNANLNVQGSVPNAHLNVHAPVPNVGINVHGPALTPPKMNINFDMYKIPDSAHAHPLIRVPKLNGECKLCRMNAAGQAGYRCDGCDVILCFNCSNRVFYGNKHKNCHPQHPLSLTSRKGGWKCDLCKTHFKMGASFYCKLCDFDACDKCYIDVGFPQGFTPPPITFFEQPDAGFSSHGNADVKFSSQGKPDAGFSSHGNADVKFSSQGKPDAGFSSHGNADVKFSSQGKPDAGFSSHGNADVKFSSQGKPDAGFSSHGNADVKFSSQGKPDAGFSSHGNADTGFSSQGKAGFSSHGNSDAELIKQLNETIKSYEAKLKVSETDFLNLKKSSMDDRSNLQATIDSLNKQLVAKDGIIKKLEIDLQKANHSIQTFDDDIARMRLDLGNLTKERDGLVMKSNHDMGEIGRLGEENKNLNFQLTAKINELASNGKLIADLNKRIADLEFQLKGRDDQIFHINGKNAEEKRQMQIQIDTINGQLIAAQNKVKDLDHLYITIKKYEEFINKMKLDIVQFQSSTQSIQIGPIPIPGGINLKIK